jgi:hypothetical protein
VAFSGCSKESQNRIERSLQNWTGVNGVLEIYSGGKLVKRFIRIDKLSTASGTSERIARPYRYGYGIMDLNFNNKVDPGEKKIYFEFSDYSTNYIFFDDPNS